MMRDSALQREESVCDECLDPPSGGTKSLTRHVVGRSLLAALSLRTKRARQGSPHGLNERSGFWHDVCNARALAHRRSGGRKANRTRASGKRGQRRESILEELLWQAH
eukprot:2813936-Heterocapsa_arctica.AAC.1